MHTAIKGKKWSLVVVDGQPRVRGARACTDPPTCLGFCLGFTYITPVFVTKLRSATDTGPGSLGGQPGVDLEKVVVNSSMLKVNYVMMYGWSSITNSGVTERIDP
jgi:hypothetical protein